jgi:hypothetical protein
MSHGHDNPSRTLKKRQQTWWDSRSPWFHPGFGSGRSASLREKGVPGGSPATRRTRGPFASLGIIALAVVAAGLVVSLVHPTEGSGS